MSNAFKLKVPVSSEAVRCEIFFREMQFKMITWPKKVKLIHIPNERIVAGKSQTFIGHIMKLTRMGMQKGAFDYIAHSDNKVIYIEFKIEKGKKKPEDLLTPHQQVFAEELTQMNIPYLVTFSIDEAVKFMEYHFLE